MGENKQIEGLCINVKVLVRGPLSNNIYVIWDDKASIVVDPATDCAAILEALEGLPPLEAIVITHAHWDHVGAAAELRDATGAPVVASEEDAPYVEEPSMVGTSRMAKACKVDGIVKNGSILEVGDMQWKIVGTPGHSLGSICMFIIPAFGCNKDGLPVLVSGDTLFEGTTGRTDFEGGSDEDMAASMKRLATLPDDTIVLPGHGNFTSIGAERQTFARFGSY